MLQSYCKRVRLQRRTARFFFVINLMLADKNMLMCTQSDEVCGVSPA